MSTLPKIDLSKLLSDAAQLERQGVSYGYGVKAPSLKCDLSDIHEIDCSGYSKFALYRAGGGLVIPDGSQAQRAWAEKLAAEGQIRKVGYTDAARYMTHSRLFICFIKPGANGCGPVGHVFFLLNTDEDAGAETLESCGGRGVCSRRWDTAVLKREIYSCYELPCQA